jgi:KaiC/GvpD/RAD55 family RecA-like ATPase
LERQILNAAFNSREAYEELELYLSKEDFNGPAQMMWEYIQSYYEEDVQAGTCDADIIKNKIERDVPKNSELFLGVLRSFEDGISIPNIIKEVLAFKKHQVGVQLSSALLSGNERQVEGLLDKYLQLQEGEIHVENEQGEIFTSKKVEDLVSSVQGDNLIPLFPKSLNQAVDGGVPRGTNIAIYARPEVGKSLISINMACGFCRRGYRVLYVGNEDPASAMLLRFITRMSGMNKYEVVANPESAQQQAEEKGYDNLVFASLAPGTIQEIEALIRVYEPDVLIVDQVRNLNVKADGLVVQLEKSSREVRTLGKRYNLVTVQVTQAGDSATNKLVLTMSDVDNSKTGFPAQFDLMIGGGCNGQFEAENKRMLSLTKNKINGNHAYFPVLVDPILTKVISI